jgi:hypothetical protein
LNDPFEEEEEIGRESLVLNWVLGSEGNHEDLGFAGGGKGHLDVFEELEGDDLAGEEFIFENVLIVDMVLEESVVESAKERVFRAVGVVLAILIFLIEETFPLCQYGLFHIALQSSQQKL